MRNTMINWLCKKALVDKRIFLITGDLGFSVLEPFADSFPNRFINAGVSEQNMVAIASGLASEGYLPYLYSIGIFPTFRCAEQIRNDVDYHNFPVTICAVGGGVAYGALGYSHHAIQDLALMRSMPNMAIGTPSSPAEVESILDWNLKALKPTYLRLHKSGEKEFHQTAPTISPGVPVEIRVKNNSKISNVAILCCSWLLASINDLIKQKNLDIDILSVPIWGQSYKKIFSLSIQNYEEILVLEDHLLDGGFGSWILEVIYEFELKIKVKIFAIEKKVVGKVASEASLIGPTLTAIEDYISKT